MNQHELDEARERRAEWMIEAAKHEDSAWGCPEDGNQQDMQSLESLSSDHLTNEEQYSSNDSDMMSFQDKEIVTEHSYSASRSGSTDMNTTTRSSATSFDRELIDFDEIEAVSADQQPRHTNQTFSSSVPPNAGGNNFSSGSSNVTKTDNPTVKTTFLKNIDSLYDRNDQASSECPSVTTTASTLSPGSVSSNGSTEPTMHSNVGSYSMSSRFSIPLSTSNSSDINSNHGGQMRGVAPTGSTDSLDRSFLDLDSNVSQMFHTMKGESTNQVPKPREKAPVTKKAAGKEEKVVEKVKLVSVPVQAPKEKPVQKKQEIILTKVATNVKPLEKANDEITQYALKGKEINPVLKEDEEIAVVKQNNMIDTQPMQDTKNEGGEKMKLQTIIEDKTSLSPPFLKEDLPTGKEYSSSTTQPFGVLETSKNVPVPLVTPHLTHEIAPAVHLSGDDAFTNYSANTKISAIEKLRQRKNGNAYAPPSVDATLQVKYFGHQRVVLKKQ